MKKTFLFLMMGIIALFSVSCDDDVAQSDVPDAVMATFQQMYPGVNAQWEKERNDQLKAEFMWQYHEMEAWFQKNGTWVMTAKDLALSELPTAIPQYVQANYPLLQIDDADWVETPTEKYYQVELDRENQADIYLRFNEQGELIP